MRGFDSIKQLIVHHSASPRSITKQRIYYWHTNPKDLKNGGVRWLGKWYENRSKLPIEVRDRKGNGWSDIGYHYIIEGDGKVEYGRPISRIGAHCRGHNRESLGVCVVGNNTVPEHKWSMQQVASLQDLVYGLRLVFPKLTVRGHDEYANTLCPGVNIQQLLQEV